tara:strand:+ start:5818 stop:7422 length:1605 start_codon:yes stop_codon:yes gene_type:complete
MNNEMKVFKAEKEAGLEHLIRSTAAIAYHSPVLLEKKSDPVTFSKDITSLKSIADVTKGAQGDQDVYSVYSVLVTTSWNKNDDVFDKDEVWLARETPKYKPTNIEHDERQIVGGIINSWPVDDHFSVISEKEDASDLPDHYHIVVASVIYRQWQDPAYQKRAQDLIAQIEAGEKYVSMECVFHGFDYAVVDPAGSHHIIPRNDESAFLTSHLRSYGGTGSYQDHQVGRLLRNITFSGKGFVQKPANPESVIFEKSRTFDFHDAAVSSKNMFSDKNGVITEIETNANTFCDKEESFDMSNDTANAQLTELKDALAALKADNKELSEKLSAANVEKYEATIEELTETQANTAKELEQAQSDLNEVAEQLDAATSEVKSKQEALEETQAKLSAIEEAEKQRARRDSLITAGLSEEDAVAKMELFGDLTDDQFEALAKTLGEYTPVETEAAEETEASDTDETDDNEAQTAAVEEASETEEAVASQVDEEVLETAEADEIVDISVESDEFAGEEVIDTVRAGLHDWVNKVILKNESGEK